MELVAATSSAEETQAVAATLAELARPGDIILLAGDLGSGKTVFAQGFGRGLGVVDRITSPTFILARHYEGRLPLHHLDVYRLEQMEEVYDVGLPEMLDDGSVTLIEWGDVIVPSLPAEFLEVRLGFGKRDDDRTLNLRAVGVVWAARRRAMATALAPWAGDTQKAAGC